MMKYKLFFFLLLCPLLSWANPVDSLLERLDKGASSKFELIVDGAIDNTDDYFELSDSHGKVRVRGNNYVSIATGIGWYLRYWAGIDVAWNNMHPRLPRRLPKVGTTVRHTSKATWRYYLNYCTLSYSMAFWDWDRWQEEIDWMALHGINLCLSNVGTDAVWDALLQRLGYSRQEAREFIAGPAFQAWWLMNNLEGWGGPVSDSWIHHSLTLQRRILGRMRSLGIHPIMPGFSGMLPHDARTKLGVNVQDPGLWNGFHRPAFLQPTDSRFADIAAAYYDELQKLYGPMEFFCMDPFHEGGSVEGVDLRAAGRAIWQAMRRASTESKWVIQAWGANPRSAMIDSLPKGSVIVLDLYSENLPQWGDSLSRWYRPKGFDGHDWIYCMLLNFGGNVGLFGRFDSVTEGYNRALRSSFASSMKGVGMTMEGIENNPMMYQLLSELPWRDTPVDRNQGITRYAQARYGRSNAQAESAWKILAATVYNSPRSAQEGTNESVFCARPSDNVWQVSTWSNMQPYYKAEDVYRAARLFVEASRDEQLSRNNNFRYDLVDVVRQALAERGREVYGLMQQALKASNAQLFKTHSDEFLRLLLSQDTLLATRTEFMLGPRIAQARSLGITPEEKDQLEWNLRTQITVWGNRQCSDEGGLHDYSHREWSGMLADFYYPRWQAWIDSQQQRLEGKPAPAIDFFAMEEAWTRRHNPFPVKSAFDAVTTVQRIANRNLAATVCSSQH